MVLQPNTFICAPGQYQPVNNQNNEWPYNIESNDRSVVIQLCDLRKIGVQFFS